LAAIARRIHTRWRQGSQEVAGIVKARADVEGYDEASDAIEAVQRMAKENLT
jgi:hypothetical protein